MFVPIPLLVLTGLLILILLVFALGRPSRRDDLIRPPSTMPHALTADQRAELAALKQSGRFIDAVRRAREMTGLGLKESKDLVESL
jgi:hypothetical protein